jgi:sarcosine oxidase / L-pipecolate oxidase
MASLRVTVVGSGIFGVTAALSLSQRGYRVTLVDPGPLPHPLAESTDISKIVRLDYGGDDSYMALMERALDGWRAWNASFREPLFHETGVLFLSRTALAPGGFEAESLRLLRARGHRAERLDASSIHDRFPAWSADAWSDGYYNPAGGFAESGRVVTALVERAVESGVELRANLRVASLIERGGRVSGVVSSAGERIEGDAVVVAAGSWTPSLLPWIASSFRTVGQPVFHLRPADPSRYAADRFPVFAADISRTGYYGFSATADGVVKIANHGVGRAMHPESDTREVTADEEKGLRAFLAAAIPDLAAAPIARTRVCVYCDTLDEHFWIARDPDREGLVVSTGGSGHGFKFAPLLGELAADALEGREDPALSRFRWRTDVATRSGEEQARYHG